MFLNTMLTSLLVMGGPNCGGLVEELEVVKLRDGGGPKSPNREVVGRLSVETGSPSSPCMSGE